MAGGVVAELLIAVESAPDHFRELLRETRFLPRVRAALSRTRATVARVTGATAMARPQDGLHSSRSSRRTGTRGA